MESSLAFDKKNPLYQEDLQYLADNARSGFLSGRSLLLTGASGLIGMHLIDALMLRGDVRVIAVGRNRSKAADRLGEYFGSPNFRFVEQDVLAPFDDALFDDAFLDGAFAPDFILPLASNTHPLAYSASPVETVLTNVEGARNALELASRHGAQVLYPSSVEIYGNARDSDDFTEDYTGNLDLSTPRSCYNESKRTCEALCQSYAAEKGVCVKIARLSRVFGPTMLPGDSKASSQFILDAVAGRDIVLKSSGKQFFSYTYVSDAVAAMLHIMHRGEPSQAYNVANPACDTTLRNFASLCAAAGGVGITFAEPSQAEKQGFSKACRAILCADKLISTGFEPHYDISDAIRRTVQMLKG